MKFAFCLFNYFPFGGLQRDFLRIAEECLRRGHEVHVYTMEWKGERHPQLPVTLVPTTGRQNHRRIKNFALNLQKILKQKKYDLVVGFNKMPGLDVYYAADTCYQSKLKNRFFWHRLTPRYFSLKSLEQSVFDMNANTEILLLAEKQQQEFESFYYTPPQRFHLLPPGISRDRVAKDNAGEIRAELRKEFNIKNEEHLLLMVGSGFKTKGLDRILLAMSSLPLDLRSKTLLFVIGSDNPKPYLKLAKKLNVNFLGGRKDVPRFLQAADLLVHPAYNENTGTVLLEALASGLPVLTTDVCGYAHYVVQAQAGKVLTSPFQQSQLNDALFIMLSADKKTWRENAIRFVERADLFDLTKHAVDFLEKRVSLNKSNNLAYFDQMMKLSGESYRSLEGRHTQRVLLNNQAYFIKQHYGVGWKEIFKNLLQLRLPILSAKNEWQALRLLHQLKINAPIVAGYGCRDLNPARLQSFLLTRELAGTISLEELTQHWRTSPPAFHTKKYLIEEIAKIAKKIHDNGLNHRDFYLCHFLFEAAANKLYLIDLHRAQIRKKIPKRWIIKDLAGLYFSSWNIGLTKRDYLRFIKVYRSQSVRQVMLNETRFWAKVIKSGKKVYAKHSG